MNLPAGLTPARLLLIVVVVGSGVVALVGLFGAKSLALSVSGLAVLGVSLFVLGVIAAAAAVRAGRDGQGTRAVAAALFGGLCMLGASGSLTLAIIIGMLAASA